VNTNVPESYFQVPTIAGRTVPWLVLEPLVPTEPEMPQPAAAAIEAAAARAVLLLSTLS